ncbi:hypothetical protein [Aidingimonas halophila]|uniref:Phasin protein n=1 Tax=Aidingimonas halophila TaxID=574349 RepID=A0A1H3C0H1_9GAMM|nr:hypothetical protein [Aidingimonas halophila]GHC27349.1 hypothetical protein GCM10008094_18730 [Aidingimonas halophila]SDX47144.1 hypothetical protein SAMN05443545_105366 [Aidingimonas halophila]
MTSDKSTPFVAHELFATSEPLVNLWLKHCMDPATPVLKLQLAWLESVSDAVRFEADFLTACADSSGKLVNCMMNPTTYRDPEQLGECYQQAWQQVTEAGVTQMSHATELSREFRERLWEEI